MVEVELVSEVVAVAGVVDAELVVSMFLFCPSRCCNDKRDLMYQSLKKAGLGGPGSGMKIYSVSGLTIQYSLTLRAKYCHQKVLSSEK